MNHKEKEKHGKRRRLLIIPGILTGIFLLVILTNLHTTKLVISNLFPEKVKLDETADWDGGKSYENVQYSDVSASDYLHLYVPDSDSEVPLYIFVHGGGFFLGDPETRQAQLFYRYVRDHGYAVATINYRLGSEAKYPAAIEDVKAAVRFLRANADQYGLDPDHFAVAGESAGGYLASMAACTNDSEFSDVHFIGEDQLAAPVSGKVQALVDFYGCIEFYTFDDQFRELGIPKVVRKAANYWLSDITKGTGMTSVEEVWIGKPASEMTDEERRSVAVTGYAKENLSQKSDLKAVILHGDADLTVPYLQSSDFAQILKAQLGDDKVSYRLFPGYGHAADGFYSSKTLDWVLAQVGFEENFNQ